MEAVQISCFSLSSYPPTKVSAHWWLQPAAKVAMVLWQQFSIALTSKFCKEESPLSISIYPFTHSELLHIFHLGSYNAVPQLVVLLLKLSQLDYWAVSSYADSSGAHPSFWHHTGLQACSGLFFPQFSNQPLLQRTPLSFGRKWHLDTTVWSATKETLFLFCFIGFSRQGFSV